MEKLVRDRIPEIIGASGRDCDYREAEPEEYGNLLMDKLDEEVAEFKEARNLEELADIMEVLFAFSSNLGYSPEELLEFNKKKRENRGSFDKHLVLRLD